MKIRNRLMIFNGLANVFLLTVFGFLSYGAVQQSLIQVVEKQLEAGVDSLKLVIESSLTIAVKTHLDALADKGKALTEFYYSRFLRGIDTEEKAYASLREVLLDPGFGKIGETGYMAGINGDGVLAIHPVSEGVDASGHEFMQRATSMKNGYLEYEWQNTGEAAPRDKAASLAYFEPWDLIIWASSYKSEFYSLFDVSDIRNRITDMRFGESGYAFIIDVEGNNIVHPTMKDKNIFDARDTDGRYFIREISETKTGKIRCFRQDSAGGPVEEELVIFEHVPELDWIVAISYRLNDFDENIRPVRNLFAVLLFGAAVLVMGINALIGYSMARPILRVREAIDSVVGETIDLSVRVDTKRNDEIGEISTGLVRFMASLKSVISQIGAAAERSRVVGDSLTCNIESTAGAVSSITEVVSALETGLNSLRDESSLTSESVSNIDGKVAGVNQAAARQAAAVEESSAAINQMIHAVDSLSQSARQRQQHLDTVTDKAAHGEEELNRLLDHIREISGTVSSIVEAVSVINSVAEQTNLLAMNAAIEAAHAGESGRGFAVVAEEIRKLAEASGENAGTIESTVRTVIEKTEEAVGVSTEAGAHISGVIREIGVFSDNLGEFVSSLAEVAAGNEQVMKALSELQDITVEVKDSAVDVSGQTTSIKEAVSRIETMIDSDLRKAEEIVSQVRAIQDAVSALAEANTDIRGSRDTLNAQVARFRS